MHPGCPNRQVLPWRRSAFSTTLCIAAPIASGAVYFRNPTVSSPRGGRRAHAPLTPRTPLEAKMKEEEERRERRKKNEPPRDGAGFATVTFLHYCTTTTQQARSNAFMYYCSMMAQQASSNASWTGSTRSLCPTCDRPQQQRRAIMPPSAGFTISGCRHADRLTHQRCKAFLVYISIVEV